MNTHPARPIRQAGCILDWLFGVAGWGEQTIIRPHCTLCGEYEDTVITLSWWHIALDWQRTQGVKHGALVGCTMAGCDGVT